MRYHFNSWNLYTLLLHPILLQQESFYRIMRSIFLIYKKLVVTIILMSLFQISITFSFQDKVDTQSLIPTLVSKQCYTTVL